MADLNGEPTANDELLYHRVERESAVRRFYCDRTGLVRLPSVISWTRSAPLTRPATACSRVGPSTKGDVCGCERRAPSEAQVELDWDRVKNFGRNHRGAPASEFARVAQLRIGAATVFAITEDIVVGFLNQLYSQKPFIINYDVRVAIAFVVVRYNPAGAPGV
jgi:hypothetical protein